MSKSLRSAAFIWGCCDGGSSRDKYVRCIDCKKVFHCSCLSIPVQSHKNTPISWKCPLCIAKDPKNTQEDDFSSCSGATEDSKQQVCNSPQNKSDGNVTQENVRDIVQQVIQREMNVLLNEINKTISEIINKEISSLRSEIDVMKDSLNFVNAQYEDYSKVMNETKKQVELMKEDNANMNVILVQTTNRINILEQNARSNNLEIQCVPEKKSENLLDIVTRLGKVVKNEIAEENILKCMRTTKINNSSPRPRSIVVQLASPRIRDQFLASVIKFNKVNPDNKLNTTHLNMKDKKSPIFITEHLSPYNKELHAAARSKAKAKGYKFVWIRSGKIYIRKNEDAAYIVVKDMSSLNNII